MSEMNKNDVILSVKDLRVNFRAYGGLVQAVRGISFDLHRGETLAIVGESGSGKSVSIRAIMGILANNAIIESGEILYDGMDLTKVKEEDFHHIRGNRIGLIFQDPLSALNPIMKIGQQITEVLHLHNKMTKEEARNRALELMRAVGIPDVERRIEQYPFQFSGGMRQRIVIAIALAGDPEILICDEPTTALDVTVQAKILELINQIKRDRNLSVILSPMTWASSPTWLTASTLCTLVRLSRPVLSKRSSSSLPIPIPGLCCPLCPTCRPRSVCWPFPAPRPT